jgi:hypothetical protein
VEEGSERTKVYMGKLLPLHVYSQYAVHIVVGSCLKGHFIHAKSPLNLEFFFFFFLPLHFYSKPLVLNLYHWQPNACHIGSYFIHSMMS